MSELLTKCARIACEAHAGQVDKQGLPYIFHVHRVAMAVAPDEQLMAVALLHDVAEDTLWNFHHAFWREVPPLVRGAVDALTRRKDEGETYAGYIERVAANDLARRVKLADLTDNLRPERISTLSPEQAASLSKRYHAAFARLIRGGGYIVTLHNEMELLREVHSVLDRSIGDSDVSHCSDEELREHAPLHWALRQVARLAFSPVAEQQPRAWECPTCGCFRPWSVGYCDGSNTGGHVLVKRDAGTPLFAGAPGAQTSVRKQLATLVDEWRETARKAMTLGPKGRTAAGAMEVCATDLQAVLNRLSAPMGISSNDGSGESDAER